MKRYFIAYSEKDGSDARCGLPFIAPNEEGFFDIDSARLEYSSLKKEGYRHLALFESEMKYKRYKFTWNYVHKHQIDKEEYKSLYKLQSVELNGSEADHLKQAFDWYLDQLRHIKDYAANDMSKEASSRSISVASEMIRKITNAIIKQ